MKKLTPKLTARQWPGIIALLLFVLLHHSSVSAQPIHSDLCVGEILTTHVYIWGGGTAGDTYFLTTCETTENNGCPNPESSAGLVGLSLDSNGSFLNQIDY